MASSFLNREVLENPFICQSIKIQYNLDYFRQYMLVLSAYPICYFKGNEETIIEYYNLIIS